MGLTELFILAVGLSMDAFAVAVCKGLAMPKVTWKKITAVGLWFGGFQALMPAAGYFLGIRFKDGITAIDHWIAFMLLSIIGINMIREAFSGDEESSNDLLDCKTMFPLPGSPGKNLCGYYAAGRNRNSGLRRVWLCTLA